MLSAKWIRWIDVVLIFVSVALVMATDMKKEEDIVKPQLEATARMFVGIFLAIIGLFIAASSGIGGGGILVPIYILVSPPPLAPPTMM